MREKIRFEKEIELLLDSPHTDFQIGPTGKQSSTRKCFECCYKLSPAERKGLGDKVDRIFAERTGITRKLDPNRSEDLSRMEEWRTIARDLVRSTVKARNPGMVTSIEPVLMNAFLSQYENDPRVPKEATKNYLTEQNLLAMGIKLRDKVISNWASGRAPLTLRQFFNLAYDITNHCGTAMLICHNVAKAFAKGGSAIQWQHNKSTGRYEDGKKSYVVKVIHPKGVIIPRPNNEGKSIFYVLFSANELGKDDPGDWYHYFVVALVAAYSTADEIGSASISVGFETQVLHDNVVYVSEQMKDASVTLTNEYKGWLWANALSFLEGAHYGESMDDVKRESAVHLSGTVFGILQAGGSIDRSWQWRVPIPKTIGKLDALTGYYNIMQHTYRILDTKGKVLSEKPGAKPGNKGSSHISVEREFL
jgi:hypothetical protein